MDEEELVERLEKLVERLEKVSWLQWERKTTRPTEKQVAEYARTCTGRTLRLDVARELARRFIVYYDKLGWKNKEGEAMTNWERAVPRWVENSESFHQRKGESIYELEQEAPSPKPSVSIVTRDNGACIATRDNGACIATRDNGACIPKPKLYGDTFSQILHPGKKADDKDRQTLNTNN